MALTITLENLPNNAHVEPGRVVIGTASITVGEIVSLLWRIAIPAQIGMAPYREMKLTNPDPVGGQEVTFKFEIVDADIPAPGTDYRVEVYALGDPFAEKTEPRTIRRMVIAKSKKSGGEKE